MQSKPSDYPSGEWALKSILIALAAVFLLQNIMRHWVGSNFMEMTFALNLFSVSKGYVHTLLTYGFLHSTDQGLPWHLIFNGLMLYWFGKEIEGRIGSQRFFECFLLCILAGGILWTSVHFLTDQNLSVVGASAGVFGILYLFCRYRWNSSMSFMFIPVQFSGKQLFWVILGFQGFFFLFGELPGSTGNSTANSAHLGGILGAFIYERYLLARPTLADFFRRLFASRETAKAPSWQKRAEAVKAKTGNRFSIKTKRAGSVKKEVDRILDKINAEGFGALSEEEKHTLDNAKDKL